MHGVDQTALAAGHLDVVSGTIDGLSHESRGANGLERHFDRESDEKGSVFPRGFEIRKCSVEKRHAVGYASGHSKIDFMKPLPHRLPAP